MVGAADDVGDAHVEVIDHDGEVVERRAVGARDHEVVLERVLERALAADDVADDGRALVGDAQAHRALPLVLAAEAAVAVLRVPGLDLVAAGGGAVGEARRRAAAARPRRGARRARTGTPAPRPSRARASAGRRRSARRSRGSSARGRCPRSGAGTDRRCRGPGASCTVPSAHPRCAGRPSARERIARASGHSMPRSAGVQNPCSSAHTSPLQVAPQRRWSEAWSAAATRSRSSTRARARGGRACTRPRRSTSSARRWRTRRLEALMIHAVYLLNCASEDPEIRGKSLTALTAALQAGAALGAHCVVLHPGSALKGAGRPGARARGGDDRRGARRVGDLPAAPRGHRRRRGDARALVRGARDADRAWRAATSASACAWTPATCWPRATTCGPRRGWAAWSTTSTPSSGSTASGRCTSTTPQTPLGSNVDRHADPGEGHLGREGCAAFLSEPRFEDLPCVLELNGPEKKDIDLARRLREEGGAARRGGG